MKATPWGFRDIMPEEAQARETIADTVKACFRAHGYLPVETPLLEKQLQGDPSRTIESMKEQYPLYRLAKPQEVGKAIAFLLSDDASFITAAALPVDGGLTSW